MLKGTVKFYNEKRRFGFINREDNKKDVFFHHSDVEGEENLEQNDEVEFEVGEGREDKDKAVKIRRVK